MRDELERAAHTSYPELVFKLINFAQIPNTAGSIGRSTDNYGYLRRNPDDAPDQNFSGYEFWLAKLNQFTMPGEDARDESVALARVRRAEMVQAFIESAEYRRRFGGAPAGSQEATKLR